ncbi:FTR1 family iron permease [Thioclava sp. F34-6]|uniref:FTR1 family iron permease n=1 Tax=Thioclava sp. F34-6 TaxID=1973003 RepID=UPI000B541275|nr:FTR1 family protein [Thioclava sp. F34-6]OWY13333.1 FTR1 family iron permease [Thioclava sp. F34-6]
MDGQIIFILWRESVEALLVIGILAGWLAHEGAGRRAARFLWGGVLTGLALALAFALTLLGFSKLLSTEVRQDLMTVMVFVAAGLIVQMVVWMRGHGRTLKRDLEAGLKAAAIRQGWWAVFLLAMAAVAREGSETVVFLYGSLAAAKQSEMTGVLASIAVGVAAAGATYALLRAGAKFLPWRGFFRVSEVMLLLLGAALFTTGVDDLVSAGILPFGAPLWDMSTLLDDGGRLGGLISALTGYRAAPDAATLGGWIVYWASVAGILRWQSRSLQARLA